MERLWSQGAWMSKALPSTRNVLVCEAWQTAVFSALLLSVCSLSITKGHQNKKACLTISFAKHSRGAFNLSEPPLLSHHCRIKLQQQQPGVDRHFWCCFITSSMVIHCSTWAESTLCVQTSQQVSVSGSEQSLWEKRVGQTVHLYSHNTHQLLWL